MFRSVRLPPRSRPSPALGDIGPWMKGWHDEKREVGMLNQARSLGTQERWLLRATLALIFLFTLMGGVSSAYQWGHRSQRPKETQFKYAGGTENIPQGCTGALELASESLTFKCFQYVVAIPYASIGLMQYRPDVSKEVRKLKLKWKGRPQGGGGKRNRYFTVQYNEGGTRHVIVLEVLPEVMRPYLAAIDLKAGKRVEVKGYEDYE